MRLLLAAFACLMMALWAPAAFAQTNDDDYTPLNSRIKRDRQFPTDLAPRFDRNQMGKVNRLRSRAMLSQFSKCLYRRSNEKSLDLLERTDLGFVSFAQIDMDANLAARVFGFKDCLSRVASTQGSGVALRFNSGSLRQWLLEQAYFSRFPDNPDWVKPGNVVRQRGLPLSENNRAVTMVLDFADCIVASDPYGADYFYRIPSGSEEETDALKSLVPAMGSCLPDGQQMEIQPFGMRIWLGEALWHAANNSVPADLLPTGKDK